MFMTNRFILFSLLVFFSFELLGQKMPVIKKETESKTPIERRKPIVKTIVKERIVRQKEIIRDTILIDNDLDGDDIVNESDKCPDEYGKITLLGCPDSDNDGFINKEDECPNLYGLLKGCPDRDADNVADKFDLCPDEKGLISESGCQFTMKKIRIVDSKKALLYEYEGESVDNIPLGQGTAKYPNGDLYKGEFKEFNKSGLGSLILLNGDKISGNWRNDKPTGKMTIYFKNGNMYSGDVKNFKMDGRGQLISSYNSDTTDGYFKEGYIHGLSTKKSRYEITTSQFYFDSLHGTTIIEIRKGWVGIKKYASPQSYH